MPATPEANTMPSRPYVQAARHHVCFVVRSKQPVGVTRLSLEMIDYVARAAVRQALRGWCDPGALWRAMVSWDRQHGQRSVYPEEGTWRSIVMHEAVYVASVATMSAWQFFNRCPPQD